MKIVVYTANTGRFDNIRPPEVHDSSVPYLCFSDSPVFRDPWMPQPCPIIYPDRARNSRIPKILPHLLMDCDYSIYHDANFALKVRPNELIGLLNGNDIALMRHPMRSSVWEEANHCRDHVIGYSEAMDVQTSRYRDGGLEGGLWCGGALIVRRHGEAATRFNEIWWREYARGCSRDQIALPWALKESGIKLLTISDNYSGSPLIARYYHAEDWPERADNPSFAEERKAAAAKESRLKELCQQ